MAQQHLGSDYNGASPSTSIDITMSLAVQVDDDIVVWRNQGGSGDIAPTDTIGNTYLAVEGPTSGLTCYHARSIGSASAGGNVVTVAQGSALRLGAAVHHLRGMDASGVDQSPAIAAAAGATNQFTTTQANEIIIGCMGGPAGSGPTPEADYGGANDEGDSVGRTWTCHRIATAILTNEQVDWTGATGQCGAVSFKEAAAAGRTTKNTRGWPLGVNVGMGWRMPA